jgi:hypothetical protein
VTGEDQHSALTVEEHGNLGETLKGPETGTGFCQKDYNSQHLGGTGTADFTFLRSLYLGGGWVESHVCYFSGCMELLPAACHLISKFSQYLGNSSICSCL